MPHHRKPPARANSDLMHRQVSDPNFDHTLNLAMMQAYFLSDPDYSFEGLDEDEAKKTKTCICIMAEVFLAIAREHGYRPRYRVKAGSGRP